MGTQAKVMPARRARATRTGEGAGGAPDVRMIPYGSLRPWADNPRRALRPETVSAVAASMAARGQDTAVKARPKADGTFEVFVGNTRLAAFGELAALGGADGAGTPYGEAYPVKVEVQDLDDEAAYEAALAENAVRRDMDPVDLAEGVLRLARSYATRAEIARRLGMSAVEVRDNIEVANLDHRAKRLLRSGERSLRWGVALAEAPPVLRARIVAEASDSRDAWPTVDTIRAAVRKGRVPAAHAIFDLAAAGIPVVADLLEPEVGWIDDVEAFRIRQMAAVEDLADRLRAEGHRAVRVLRDQPFEPYGFRADPEDPRREAVVEVSREGRVTVHRDLVPRFDASEGRGASAAAHGFEDVLEGFGDAAVGAASGVAAAPTRPRSVAAYAEAKAAAGVAAMRADPVMALRLLATAILNRTEVTYAEAGLTDEHALARDEARAAAGLPGRRDVRPEELPSDVAGLADLLAGLAAGVLSAVPSRRAPFPEGGGTLVGAALMEPGAMRRAWTPGPALFDALTVEEARAVAADVLRDEALPVSAMSGRQVRATLSAAFRDAAAGTGGYGAATLARLARWVPPHMGVPAPEAPAEAVEGFDDL